MKLRIAVILATLAAAGVTVSLLVHYSPTDYYRQDVVIRKFLSPPLSVISVREIPDYSCYIAGVTPTRVYLGSTRRPLLLMIVPIQRTGMIKEVSVLSPELTFREATRITIDSPDFYVAGLSSHVLLHGLLDSMIARRFVGDSTYFAEAVPITQQSVAIRAIVKRFNEFVLAKQTAFSPFFVTAPGLLQKQVDGLFCTDGMLHYSREMSQLVYVYYYRNQFFSADTSLSLVYRAMTIDTTRYAQFAVATVKSRNIRTRRSVPRIINNRSCVSGGWLFIQSNMIGRGEDEDVREGCSVIDTYDLKTGGYQGSFYLPHYGGMQVRDMKVVSGFLIALQGNYLVTYSLPKSVHARK